eukprot:scaffold107168_cov45-Attheya_sp.AAC.2
MSHSESGKRPEGSFQFPRYSNSLVSKMPDSFEVLGYREFSRQMFPHSCRRFVPESNVSRCLCCLQKIPRNQRNDRWLKREEGRRQMQ